MADYVVNVNDETTPTNGQPARKGAEEIRAIKAALETALIANTASASPRQVIASAVLDSNGYNNAITTGSGLRPALTASAGSPYHLSYAAGFNAGKAANNEEAIAANNADILGVDLPLNNISYLYKNYANPYGSTLVPEHDGYIFDKPSGSLLHFEEVATPLDDFGNVYTITGATLTATKPAYGAKSLDCSGGAGTNANTKRAESAAFLTLGGGSWEISAVVWFDVQPNAAVNHYVASAVNNAGFGAIVGWGETGGNRRAVLFISSNGTSQDVVNGTFGVTNLATGTWYRFRMVFDALAGTYRVYVAAGGSGAAPVWTAEVQEISAASAARVCAVTKLIWGCSFNGGYVNGISGFIDEARYIRAATRTTTETPTGFPKTIADSGLLIHFFSIPKMTMFQVTAPSAAAGTDPTLTAVTRLFIAEADTSGVAVTTIRNRAIKGQWEGSVITPLPAAAGSVANVSHNIGTQRTRGKIQLINLTTQNGYVPGDVIENVLGGATTDPQPINLSIGRNTIGFGTPAGNTIILTPRTGGAAVAATVGSWAYRLSAERSY